MCFMLFAGTDEPLPLREWRKDTPDIWVRPVGDNEVEVRAHFSKPVVQYVGATSGCGCDFPHWLLHNGKQLDVPIDEPDPEAAASAEYNRVALATLLEDSARGSAELYGVWAGNWRRTPVAVEQISIDRIRERSFRLGEQVFYRVRL